MQKRQKGPIVRVNERILYNTQDVRVVGPNSEQYGVLPVSQALAKAREVGLDLVEVAPGATPPVCRILDFGKFRYEEAKKTRAAKAKQHVIKIKELKLHPKTDINDYTYRLERGKEFLAKGYKLKVTIVFRGRELAHVEYGSRWLKQMETDLDGIAVIDSPVKREGRSISAVFSPSKKGVKPKPEKSKETEIQEQ